MSIKIVWQERFEILLNPEDDYYKSFFSNKITQMQAEKLFPKKGVLSQICNVVTTFNRFLIAKLKQKLFGNPPLEYEEYMKLYGS